MTENYPGQYTEFFIVSGGIPVGPIVGLVEVFKHNISPDTPVWYEGLADWTPALMADLTRQLFTPVSPFFKAHPEALQIMQGRITGADPDTLPTLVDDPEVPAADIEPAPSPAPTATSSAASLSNITSIETPTEKPAAYLTLAIIVTIIGFFPTGLIAVYYATRVNALNKKGNLVDARTSSEITQWWIAITIVIGFFFAATMILTGGLFPYGV